MRTKNRIMSAGLVLAVAASVLVSAVPPDDPDRSSDAAASPADTEPVPDGLVPAGPDEPPAPAE